MIEQQENLGYRDDFLGDDDLRISILLIVNPQQYEVAKLKDFPGKVTLDYLNYSVIMDRERKFPILTASNVDGAQFKRVERAGSWKKDKRIDEDDQWGSALYKAEFSDFDKGHMTKREDVQWGTDEEIATEAAKSTFYYTNAVPQHALLNRSVWRSIERYVLKSETVKHQLRVTVLTGPVLHHLDPEFVTPVKGARVQIPILFWKIIYYTKEDGTLCRTAFLTSQKDLLESDGIIRKSPKIRSITKEEDYFQDFKDAETFQVRVDLIEELTALNFPAANENYQDDRPNKLIFDQVNVGARARGMGAVEEIKNLIL